MTLSSWHENLKKCSITSVETGFKVFFGYIAVSDTFGHAVNENRVLEGYISTGVGKGFSVLRHLLVFSNRLVFSVSF